MASGTVAPYFTGTESNLSQRFAQGNSSFTTTNPNLNASDLPIRQRDTDLLKVEFAVHALILFSSMVGNFLVIIVIGLKHASKATKVNVLFLYLAVSDLLNGLLNTLPELAKDITYEFLAGTAVCKLVQFGQGLVMTTSCYIAVVISLDRYHAVCHPLSHRCITKKHVHWIVALTCLAAAIFNIPQLIVFRVDFISRIGIDYCIAKFTPSYTGKMHVLFFSAVIYFLPLLLIVILYCLILKVIFQRASEEKEKDVSAVLHLVNLTTPKPCANPRPRPLSRVHTSGLFKRAKNTSLRLAAVVIATHFICWSPFFIAHLIWLAHPELGKKAVMVLLTLLGSLNAAVNPWIFLLIGGKKPCGLLRQCVTNHREASKRRSFSMRTLSSDRSATGFAGRNSARKKFRLWKLNEEEERAESYVGTTDGEFSDSSVLIQPLDADS